MPQYMLLIYSPADEQIPADDPGMDSSRWMAFTSGLQEQGLLVGGDRLDETATATTVRVRDGETLVTDGPFAETSEYLAGYYLIDAPDLDAALKHAARMPNTHYGSVEVRPVMEDPYAA